MLLIRQEIFHFKVVIKKSLLLYIFPNTTVLSVIVSISVKDIWLPLQILPRIMDSLFSDLQGKNLGPLNETRSLSLFSRTLILLNYYVFCTYTVSICLVQVLQVKFEKFGTIGYYN